MPLLEHQEIYIPTGEMTVLDFPFKLGDIDPTGFIGKGPGAYQGGGTYDSFDLSSVADNTAQPTKGTKPALPKVDSAVALTQPINIKKGVNTLAIAKRLMDSNYHPPTVYFPLIVHEAIMIEPTETESKVRLDEFINAMIEIAQEVENNPEEVLKHPLNTPVKRVDETYAARNLDLAYKKQQEKLCVS